MGVFVNEKGGSLMSDARRQLILDRLSNGAEVTVEEIASQCGVSLVTVRGDFKRLAQAGTVLRTRGGARLSPAASRNREHKSTEKKLIGEAAAALVDPGETIVLDGGSTTLEIARSLPADIQLTVITGSIAIVNELVKRPNVELHVLGGVLDRQEGIMIGNTAEAQLTQFLAHKVFLGACGIDDEFDVVDTSTEVARYKRVMLNSARQRILVADASKWGIGASSKTMAVTEFSVVVTDEEVPAEYVSYLVEHRVSVLTGRPLGLVP